MSSSSTNAKSSDYIKIEDEDDEISIKSCDYIAIEDDCNKSTTASQSSEKIPLVLPSTSNKSSYSVTTEVHRNKSMAASRNSTGGGPSTPQATSAKSSHSINTQSHCIKLMTPSQSSAGVGAAFASWPKAKSSYSINTQGHLNESVTASQSSAEELLTPSSTTSAESRTSSLPSSRSMAGTSNHNENQIRDHKPLPVLKTYIANVAVAIGHTFSTTISGIKHKLDELEKMMKLENQSGLRLPKRIEGLELKLKELENGILDIANAILEKDEVKALNITASTVNLKLEALEKEFYGKMKQDGSFHERFEKLKNELH